MIFLILALSCTFKELRVKEKGKREDISRAIQNSNEEDSRAIIKKIDEYEALHKNKEGLLPVEEAIEAGNIEAVEILINLDDCEYPYKIYEKIVDTGSVDMFKLISERKLDYRLLLRIKENDYKELEREFLKRIEVTELERLILSGEIGEIKKKSKEWVLANYKDDKAHVNKRGISTAEISCIYGGTDFIKEIIEILGKDIKDIKGCLLFTVSKLGEKGAVECLLDLGIDVNQKLDDGSTALIYAAQGGNKEVCELFIEKGADVNAVKEDRNTALMIAAQEGHGEVCELLIGRDADVNAVEEDGSTALMVASQNGHKEVCELLIDKEADVNAVEEDGWTALMFAAQNGHKEVCDLLVYEGTEVDTLGKDDGTALIYAAENGHSNIVELLISHGAQFDQMDPGIRENKLVAKLKSYRDKILHLDEESLTKGKLVSLFKILEKKIVKGENLREILEDIRKRKRSIGVNTSWKDAVEELVKLIINREGEDIERRVENEKIEKLLIRNCLMREVIKIEKESKKRKYKEDRERCVRNKKEN